MKGEMDTLEADVLWRSDSRRVVLSMLNTERNIHSQQKRLILAQETKLHKLRILKKQKKVESRAEM